MTGRAAASRLLAGSTLMNALSAASPLLMIPAITSGHGSRGWLAVAVGQSIGSAGAVFVELGWGMTGPQGVARMSSRERVQAYRLSLYSRCFVAAVVLPVVMLVAALVAPVEPVVGMLSAAGAALIGLSPLWFYLGSARPARGLLADSLPRLLMVLVGAAALAFGAPLWIAPASALTSGLLAPLLGWLLIPGRRDRGAAPTRAEVLSSVRAQGSAVGGRAVSALYIALPVTLVTVVAPSSAAAFAAAERLLRMLLALLQSVPSAMQNWVGAARGSREVTTRIAAAVRVNAALGMVAGTSFFLLGPFIADVVFTDTVQLSHQLCGIAGAVVLLTCVSRATGGLGLVRVDQIRTILLSAVVGAVIGVPCILLLAREFGPAGGLAGELLGELAVVIIQASVLWRVLARRREDDAVHVFVAPVTEPGELPR